MEKKDNIRNQMGFDWMYMNAIDNIEELIEEYEVGLEGSQEKEE